MDTTNPFIEVNNLRRSFKDIEAIAGISFSVQRGEILGLLGLNGAGKTITIRLLTGQTVSATS
jgi:ABC-type multidrug transport system ATPase subunit